MKTILNLTNVSDGTNPAGTLSVAMRICVGDANADGTDNSGDATVVRNDSGQLANAGNFRSDLNADGVINSADTTIARNHSGDQVPP